jgi:hypothetical protein
MRTEDAWHNVFGSILTLLVPLPIPSLSCLEQMSLIHIWLQFGFVYLSSKICPLLMPQRRPKNRSAISRPSRAAAVGKGRLYYIMQIWFWICLLEQHRSHFRSRSGARLILDYIMRMRRTRYSIFKSRLSSMSHSLAKTLGSTSRPAKSGDHIWRYSTICPDHSTGARAVVVCTGWRNALFLTYSI